MSEELKTKAQQLFEEGKACFQKNEHEASVSKLGEACQLLDQLNGDLAPANGDAYFLYGQALLQYAIHQNTVLGQSAQASAEAVEKQQEQEQEVKSSNPLFQLNAVPEFNATTEEEKEEEEDEEEEEDAVEQGAADDDFETAWDILDVARVIFEKGEDKETQLKLADVHLCLGDVSLETEKFNEALADYEKAISIKQSVLESDNRELAEAHYKYALALEFSTEKANEAVPELQKAVQVLQNRVEKLETSEGKGKGKETEVSKGASDEILEIKELITDMQLKIEDLEQRQATEKEAEALLKAMLGYGKEKTEAKQISASTPVNDLTTLVKRKVKEVTKEEQDTKDKKQKLE
ncbi:uncharacterized protein B0P05DRAFT_536773 [Gilbertella persicaria]|uniref:uncharacterized protein n=1 Tax=Gilbertella persicaria TaxID=101096 RepID=UPI00221F4D1A|nr:uncharacterized protein B0P05DRAFT_536773 [Gilbertella persicaria]KAI8083278.1 hypothetical protein B0P05DRAFT_536773 [Gilbertella persicaria]